MYALVALLSLDRASDRYTDRVLYPEERLARITREAAEGDAIFSLNDRIGLVHDAMALAKSGHATVSSALTVVDMFRNEAECRYFCFVSMLFTDSLVNLAVLVWDSIAENLALLVSTWWEDERIVRGLNGFRKASAAIPRLHPIINLVFYAGSFRADRG